MHSLLTEDELQKYDDLVLKKLQAAPANYSVDATHSAYGQAFLRYLLFQEWPKLIADLNLSECDLYYNRYFWARRFANAYQAVHGSDAGLEQQVFQILEQAPSVTDWTIIEAIDNRFRQ